MALLHALCCPLFLCTRNCTEDRALVVLFSCRGTAMAAVREGQGRAQAGGFIRSEPLDPSCAYLTALPRSQPLSQREQSPGEKVLCRLRGSTTQGCSTLVLQPK